jgi:hypothetical protein
MGVNCTLASWWTGGGGVIQVGATSSISCTENGVSAFFSNNAYYDNTDTRWEFINGSPATGAAQMQMTEAGAIIFRTAGSATANGAITWSNKFSIALDGTVNVLAGAGGGNRAVYVDNAGDIWFS